MKIRKDGETTFGCVVRLFIQSILNIICLLAVATMIGGCWLQCSKDIQRVRLEREQQKRNINIQIGETR